MNTHDLDLRLTNHACKMAAKRGVQPQTIHDAFYHGAVTPSEDRPGQWKVTGAGITLFGVQEAEKFLVITLKESK